MKKAQTKNRIATVFEFLALQKSTMGVFAMVILVGMGERMAERFLPIYILALGGGTMAIGLLQAMDNFLSALYSYPGGYLSDRIGTKKALMLFNLLAIAGFGIVIAIPAWQAVLAGAILFISWSSISLPATMSLIYKVLPSSKRTMGASLYSLTARIPMAAGPLIGGVLISVWGEQNGVRAAFLAALIMAVIALFFQQIMIDSDTPETSLNQKKPSDPDSCRLSIERNPIKLFSLMNPAMKKLLVADILIRFCEQIPYAFVVIWCMKTIAAPVSAVQFGFLSTIEMVTAMIIYIPVAHMAGSSTKKPFVLMTFVFFTFFPLLLLFSQSYGWLIVAFILRGLKEFGEPTRKALIMDLAPDHCRAAMFGLYYLIRDIIVALAALGGALLWAINPQVNLIAAFGFGVLGTIGFAIWGSDIKTGQNNLNP